MCPVWLVRFRPQLAPIPVPYASYAERESTAMLWEPRAKKHAEIARQASMSRPRATMHQQIAYHATPARFRPASEPYQAQHVRPVRRERTPRLQATRSRVPAYSVTSASTLCHWQPPHMKRAIVVQQARHHHLAATMKQIVWTYALQASQGCLGHVLPARQALTSRIQAAGDVWSAQPIQEAYQGEPPANARQDSRE